MEHLVLQVAQVRPGLKVLQGQLGLVHKVRLEQQDLLEQLDNPVCRAVLVLLALAVPLVLSVTLVTEAPLELLVTEAHQGHAAEMVTPAQLAQWAKSVLLDLKVLLASPEPLDHLDCLEYLDSLDHVDSRVTVVSRGLLVSLASRERSVFLVILVFLVSLVVLVPQDKSVSLDQMEALVPVDFRVLQDLKAGLAIRGSLDSLGILVILEVLDQLEDLEIKDSKVSRALWGMSVLWDNQGVLEQLASLVSLDSVD